MLLTKRYLKKLLENMRATLPEYRERELLEHFGKISIDTNGYKRDYTEQDISENVRKVIQEEELNKKAVIPEFLLKYIKQEDIPF